MIQWWINSQKDEGLRPDNIREDKDPYLSVMVKIYRSYEELCNRLGVIDFAELLLRALELWKNCPSVLAHYQNRFKHILIDELINQRKL